MNQIALGDEIAGYTVLDGASVLPPNFKAIPFFNDSSLPAIEETIEIQLKGASAQIDVFLSTLAGVVRRSVQYEKGVYPSPQCLRFQRAAGEPYYFAPVSNLSYSSNPAGYLSHAAGSRLITLNYTRLNHFEGSQMQVPLTGIAGAINPPDPVPIYNATQPNYANSVLIDAADFSTDLPAPLRLELTFLSQAEYLADIYCGIYHHAVNQLASPFFFYQNAFSGGIKTNHADAISGAYKTYTDTNAGWAEFFLLSLNAPLIHVYSGYSYRPLLHLFAPHAYDDLYLRYKIQYGTTDLFTSEPIWSPPGYDYIILPPTTLPPNFLLREAPAAALFFSIEYFRVSGNVTTLALDCLTFFPVSYAASFFGFRPLTYGNTFIYDSWLDRFNTRLLPTEGELVSHARVGGPLLLFPGEHTRLFIAFVDHQKLMKPKLQAELKVFYRPRLQCL